MKKTLSLLIFSLLLGLGVLNAQNQRTVVLECFTSATCPPCASINPSLDNLINNNADKLIAIKYHVNWPTNHDPMNHHNIADVSAKVSYYSVSSVPTSVGDGTWKNDSDVVNQNLINQWAAVPSPLEMRMTHFFNAAQDTMFVVVMGKATTDIDSDNLKLNVAVLEKTMEYATAPGTNGERIFHNVMKKMLPKAAGESLYDLDAGEYFAFSYSWALANVMNINELTAVAWVQDNDTKQVFQGCKSSENLQPFYQRQAKIVDAIYMQNYTCTGTISPKIVVKNYGSEAINTLKINAYNNDVLIKTINWQGNIEFCKSKTIDLGEMNFTVAEENDIEFELELINGYPDDYSTPDYDYDIHTANVVVNQAFKFYVRTSNEPESITWEIINNNTGDVVLSGGPYTQAHKIFEHDFNLDADGCYSVVLHDAGNNGLGTGDVRFSLKAGNTSLFTCEYFYDVCREEFYYIDTDGVSEVVGSAANVYPNPTTGTITVETDVNGDAAVYNTAGQLVYNQKVEGTTVLNLSNLEKGTYLFVLTSENGENTKQIIVLQ